MSCRGWSSDAYWAGRVARELGERGHHVTFVARRGATGVLDRLRELGVGDLRTLSFRGRRAPRESLADLLAVRAFLGAHDVVHVHRGKEHWMAVVANLVASRPVPLVRTRHIVGPVATHAANRWLYRRATAHVIAVSQQIRRQYLASRLLGPERVTAVLGGVDDRIFHPGIDGQPFRKQVGLDGGPVVGVLASLRKRKGHRVFIEAARLVRERRPEVRFVIAGAGRQAGPTRRLVAELGLEDGVRMTGFVSRPAEALAALDVAVYPALSSEGMGRVLYEYMAMARPIVATRVGLAPEVLEHGETALLVPPGDAPALAQAIDRLLADRPLAVATGRRCRGRVEDRYSGRAVARAVEAVYLAAMARSPRWDGPR
jgi:glycosyltransferase involved in cell wall biosynthesis